MASSDSKGPFEKFKVKSTPFDKWDFAVSVTGTRIRNKRAMDDIIEERRQFIEDAIREKLERERQP